VVLLNDVSVIVVLDRDGRAGRRQARDEVSLGGDRGQGLCAVPERAGRWVAGMDAGGARDFAGSLRDPVVHVDAAPKVGDRHQEDEKRNEHEREFDEALARLPSLARRAGRPTPTAHGFTRMSTTPVVLRPAALVTVR
jgi:hypothetical protein